MREEDRRGRGRQQQERVNLPQGRVERELPVPSPSSTTDVFTKEKSAWRGEAGKEGTR